MNKRHRWLLRKMSHALIFFVMANAVFGAFASSVSAASESSRIAQIVSLSGEVFVKKSGGSKEFKAYKSMALNQGDFLRTGKKSSVTLKVIDHDDELTIGANAQLYLSKLKDSGGGKKTNVSMVSGSAYVKAGKLKEKDTFEIETPTAVMGVRGTNFLVGVNHVTGNTDIAVASGIVQANPIVPQGTGPAAAAPTPPQPVIIYPAQQGSFLVNTGSGTVNTAVSIMDPAKLVGTIDPAATAAMLQNAAKIKEENEQLLANLNSGQPNNNLGVTNNEEFAQYANNVGRLADVVATQAVQQGVLSPQQVDQISQQAGVPISTNAAPLSLTPAQQQQAQQAAQLEQRIQQQGQQTQQQIQQNQQRNQSLLNEITTRQQQQNQQNQQAQNQMAQQAEQNYVSRLNEEQRQQFNQNKTQINNSVPATPPVVTPPSTTPPVVTPVPPVVSLITPAGNVHIGDEIKASSTLPGTLYLVPEATNAGASAFEEAVVAGNGKKAEQQSVPSSVTFSTAGLPAGNYAVYAVANGTNGISAKSTVYTLLVAVPPKPESVTFVDTDSNDGNIGGTVRIARALDEKYVTGYQLYWGNAAGDILANTSTGGLIANVGKTGTSAYVEYAIPIGTKYPSGTGTILAFSVNGALKSANAARVAMIDAKPVTGTPSAPRGIDFVDINPAEGKLSGSVRILRAPDETNITGYELHWGDANGNLLGASSFIALVNKAGAAEYAVYDIPGELTIPSGAKKLIAFSVTGTVRSDGKATAAIHDNMDGMHYPHVMYVGSSLMKAGKVSLPMQVNEPATLYVIDPIVAMPGGSAEYESAKPTLETLIGGSVESFSVDAGTPVIEPTLPKGTFVIYAVDRDGNVSYPTIWFDVVEADTMLSSISGTVTLPQTVSHPVTVMILGSNYSIESTDETSGRFVYSHAIVPAGSKDAKFAIPVIAGSSGFKLSYHLMVSTVETERWVPYNELNGTYVSGDGGVQATLTTGVKLSGDVTVSAENRDNTKPLGVNLQIMNDNYHNSYFVDVVPGGAAAHYEFVVPPGEGYKLHYYIYSEANSGQNYGEFDVPSLTTSDAALNVTVPGKKFDDPPLPTEIAFTDTNPEEGKLEGTVTVYGNHILQTGIVLYWGDEWGKPLPNLDPIAVMNGSGVVSYEFTAPIAIPAGAKTFVAYGLNGPKQSADSMNVFFADLYESLDPDLTPPTVVYLGSSTVVVKGEWDVYVSEPGRLYVGRSDVISDEMASDGFDLSDLDNAELFSYVGNVIAGRNTITTDVIVAGDSYQFVAVDENGNMSIPSESFWVLSSESIVSTISGTVTLPEEAGTGGAIVKVVAKENSYSGEFLNVWIAPGEDSATYSVIVESYSNYMVGYEVVSPDPDAEEWVASWVLLDEEGNEERYAPGTENVPVLVLKGVPLSGIIELSTENRDPDTEAVVVVTVDNGELNASKAFRMLPGQPLDYSIIVPIGTNYTVQYNVAGETNVWFYTSSGAGYTSSPLAAQLLDLSADGVPNATLIVPAKTDNVTGIQVTKASPGSFAARFDLYQTQTMYRLDLYQGSVLLEQDIRINPSDPTAGVVETGDIGLLDATLQAGVEYKLVVTAYGAYDSDYQTPLGSGFVKFALGSDIQANADVFSKSAVVKWNPVFGADSYRLTVNDGTPITIEKPEWELVDLIPGTDYSIAIESVGSASQPVTVPFTTPSTANPTVTEATYGYNETLGPILTYNVTWDAVSGAVNYEVKLNGTNVINTNLTSMALENVKYGQTYVVEIIGSDNNGVVVSRDKKQWVTQNYDGVPGVEIYSGSGGLLGWMNVVWSEYPGATEYRVYVDGELKETIVDLTNPENLYFSLEGITFFHPYTIRVEAWNDGGSAPAALTEMKHTPLLDMSL